MRARVLLQGLVILIVQTAYIYRAKAEIISMTLHGHVTGIGSTDINGVDDTAAFQSVLPFTVGSPIRTTISWDTSAASQTFGDNALLYVDAADYQFQIGDTLFHTTANIGVSNNENGVDQFLIFSVNAYDAPGWQYIAPLGYGYSDRTSLIGSSLLFNSPALPTQPFNDGDFGNMMFDLSDGPASGNGVQFINTVITPLGSHTGQSRFIIGVYDSIQAVPEPGTLAVSSVFAACMFYRARAKSHRKTRSQRDESRV